MKELRLVKYNAMAQHMGTWLKGFDWNIYGCGTYRNPVSETYAQALMKRFMEHLNRQLRTRVTYFAALERRYSGCGYSPIPVHWHFLAVSDRSESMAALAKDLWEEKFGNAEIERYDPTKDGAYYVCKLATHPNGLTVINNLDRLEYRGPSDLIAATYSDPYVPDHLKGKVFGEYLRMA